MAVEKDTIDAQLKELTYFDQFFTAKEVRYLPEVIRPDERMHALISGLLDDGSALGSMTTWLIVATDQRLVFLNKGMIYGLRQLDMPLGEIKGIRHKTGLVFGEITVSTGGMEKKIEQLWKGGTNKFAAILSGLIRDSRATPAGSANPLQRPDEGDDALVQLERLGKLRESGVLTDDEFQEQKRRVLGGPAAARTATPQQSSNPSPPLRQTAVEVGASDPLLSNTKTEGPAGSVGPATSGPLDNPPHSAISEAVADEPAETAPATRPGVVDPAVETSTWTEPVVLGDSVEPPPAGLSLGKGCSALFGVWFIASIFACAVGLAGFWSLLVAGATIFLITESPTRTAKWTLGVAGALAALLVFGMGQTEGEPTGGPDDETQALADADAEQAARERRAGREAALLIRAGKLAEEPEKNRDSLLALEVDLKRLPELPPSIAAVLAGYHSDEASTSLASNDAERAVVEARIALGFTRDDSQARTVLGEALSLRASKFLSAGESETATRGADLAAVLAEIDEAVTLAPDEPNLLEARGLVVAEIDRLEHAAEEERLQEEAEAEEEEEQARMAAEREQAAADRARLAERTFVGIGPDTLFEKLLYSTSKQEIWETKYGGRYVRWSAKFVQKDLGVFSFLRANVGERVVIKCSSLDSSYSADNLDSISRWQKIKVEGQLLSFVKKAGEERMTITLGECIVK